jgi:hypothetical protein
VNIHGAKIVTPLLRDSLRSLGILPHKPYDVMPLYSTRSGGRVLRQ